MIELLTRATELLMLGAAALFLWRMVRGPSPFDRLAALEALALAVVGFVLLEAAAAETRLYVDAALGLALFSFVGAVVFAHFLGRGEIDD
jgi:multisubunit Na+/H+ antiporter MnhF subunit